MKRLDRMSPGRKQINVVLTTARFAQLEELSKNDTKTAVISKLIADEFERRNHRGDQPVTGSGGPPPSDSGRPGPEPGGSGVDHARVEPVDGPAAVDDLDTIA